MAHSPDQPDDLKGQIIDLSEGNPGAVTVLGGLVNDRPDEASTILEKLDAMNLRGSRIWLGYKDYCGEDMDEFVACVMNGDEEMIDLINQRSRKDAPDVRPA